MSNVINISNAAVDPRLVESIERLLQRARGGAVKALAFVEHQRDDVINSELFLPCTSYRHLSRGAVDLAELIFKQEPDGPL